MGWRRIAMSGVVCLAATLTGAADLKVRAHWPLPGPVGWDYLQVDADGARLFVTRGTQVDVLDTHDGQLIATIPGTRGAHGVALAEGLQRGYISNGKNDTVTMFDLHSYKTLQEAPVSGHDPDAILYDSVGQHLFTFNGRSSNVTVLSPANLQVLTTFKLPGKPEFAADDDDGQIFVNIETEPGQMVVIDAEKLSVKAVWTLPGCDSPTGLSLDKTHHRLFSVCDDKVMVVTDAATGAQVSRVAIGLRPDAVAYDPKRSMLFSSNGEGSLTVVHQDSPDHYHIIQTLTTQSGSRTMALDPVSGNVYLSSARFATVPAPEHGRPVALPDSFAVLEVSP